MADDEIWTDLQRDLFKDIVWAHKQIAEIDDTREKRIDFLALKVKQMAGTGMKKNRISKVFQMSQHTVDDLIERGNTVQALMEAEAGE